MIHSCLVWFLWWLRHGAIGPFEATPVGVNVDWPEFWIYTFELVIHLSKVQQMALLFFSHFEISCCSGCPRDPSDLLFQVKPYRTFRNFLFCAISQRHLATLHEIGSGRLTTFRCGVSFFWWLSGEVKHFVHLIRWNLKAVLCPCGWLEHGPGLAQRTTFRFRNWILFLINCFGFPVCHQLVPHLVPNFPACLSVMCRGV